MMISSQKFVSPPVVGFSSRLASSRAKASTGAPPNREDGVDVIISMSKSKFPRRLTQTMPMRASPTRLARPRVVVFALASSSEDFGKESSSASSPEIENQTEEEEEEEEDVDERLATVLDRVSRLSERYQTVLERTRRQKKVLENARRCDVDVVRANEGNECDFQAVLKTEAYVKR